jgi:hypothetical protein
VIEKTVGGADAWLAANGGVSLLVSGFALVAAALIFEPAAGVAAAMTVMGVAVGAVGILLPNLEGSLKVGPAGVEAVLRKVDERAVEQGLDEDDRALVVGDAYRLLDELWEASGTWSPSPIRSWLRPGRVHQGDHGDPVENVDGSALADRIIRQITDTEEIPVGGVPNEAIETVRQTSGNGTLQLVEAQRRSGRGAPRWHLRMNDGSWWRVSNTVHGWNASRLEAEVGESTTSIDRAVGPAVS